MCHTGQCTWIVVYVECNEPCLHLHIKHQNDQKGKAVAKAMCEQGLRLLGAPNILLYRCILQFQTFAWSTGLCDNMSLVQWSRATKTRENCYSKWTCAHHDHTSIWLLRKKVTWNKLFMCKSHPLFEHTNLPGTREIDGENCACRIQKSETEASCSDYFLNTFPYSDSWFRHFSRSSFSFSVSPIRWKFIQYFQKHNQK